MKPLKTLQAIALSLLLSAMLVVAVGCGSQQSSSAASSAAASSSASGSGSAPTSEQYQTVLDPHSIVTTFVGEKFYDQKIASEDDAIAAVKGAYDRIGADDTTDLVLTAVTGSETGTTYYSFNQVAGDVFVHGAGVKVIADKDGNAAGLVSAILPKVEMPKAEDWEITAAQAEEAVLKQCEEDGHAGMKVVADATEQTLIHIPNLIDRLQYAWVVYTPNYDTDSEMAYLAHYVDGSGTYMYAIPIAEPRNADAEAGDKANFDFDKYEQGTWKGELKLHDGTTREAEVPVLVDKSDNTYILADAKRKILCADCADWRYHDTLSPRVSSENSFDNVELLAYDTFIKVWDFYDGVGWKGPDGVGTPTLLLMDYVNANGEPEDQAMYSGRQNGFQVFSFNRLNPDGENMDIVAHEFTHCVTSTAMTTNIYLNETGAINEGMSDVMGNLIEMLLADKPENAWLMGAGSGVRTYRSMKDPHEYDQPAFRWDTYFVPSVAVGTITNDFGGVHVNSSLLNIVSYKLDQAGMAPDDQFYFWLNVAMATTAWTDYAQLAQLLPWCMEQSGYPQYVDALREAVDAAGYANLEEPATPPAGAGMIALAYDAQGLSDAGLVRFTLDTSLSGNFYLESWPAAATNKALFTVPAGDYYCVALIGNADPEACVSYIYTEGGWEPKSEGKGTAAAVHVEEGKTLELPVTGLPKTADELEK